jgi:hypothetical protein
MMGVILLSIIGVALAMLTMAVGAIVSNRCLRGSCGGREVLGFDGEPLTCDTCPLRDTPQSDARATARRPPRP